MIQIYQNPDLQAVLALYDSVGWTNYTKNPAMLEKALAHSLKVYACIEEGKLLGLLRVVGDGHSIIYIQDILVHPGRQRRGIGKALLEQALADFAEVYQKVLLTDDSKKTCAFYESLGFHRVDKLSCVAYMKNY